MTLPAHYDGREIEWSASAQQRLSPNIAIPDGEIGELARVGLVRRIFITERGNMVRAGRLK